MAAVARTIRLRFWLWLIGVIGVIVPRRLPDILEGLPSPEEFTY